VTRTNTRFWAAEESVFVDICLSILRGLHCRGFYEGVNFR
jgi:hypothetical protein